MPEKQVKFHIDDAPWVTNDFKNLIKRRQWALASGNTIAFKFYRNKVNRVRKTLRGNYYTSKVGNLQQLNPKKWWSEVKRLGGMSSSSRLVNLLPQLQTESTDPLSPTQYANLINNIFLEPMQEYSPLRHEDLPTLFQQSPSDPRNNEFILTSQVTVYNKLKRLNPSKAPGPDCIPNWILKEYAELLASPISNMLNASFDEQKLPRAWKRANITPIPKEKPVRDVNRHLRPVSLTPSLSKLAEEFVVEKFFAPAILGIVDPAQFGGIPRSSPTLALIDMLHNWTKATDGNGGSIRVVLFDYRKAFDLIDHRLLAENILLLPIPNSVKNWVLHFLMDREQRVKLSNDCLSEWGSVPSGVPQGTKLGPWLFILMINDLRPTTAQNWKYIDDTTISEIIPRNGSSNIQHAANEVKSWSVANRLHLNRSKCKELLIYFAKTDINFPRVCVYNEDLELVTSAKILGLTIRDDF